MYFSFLSRQGLTTDPPPQPAKLPQFSHSSLTTPTTNKLKRLSFHRRTADKHHSKPHPNNQLNTTIKPPNHPCSSSLNSLESTSEKQQTPN
uniref:Putative ovule protein n=1 Tax=Solanum chacoense TaxID=4108 RepID=A0A0V0HLN8_SOLCH